MAEKKDRTGAVILTGIGLLLLFGDKKNGKGVDRLGSAFYTMTDFQNSDTAVAKNIDEQFEKPPVQYIQAGHHFVVNTLDPLTAALGYKIPFDSWYRHPKLNKEVGGSDTSFHLTGEAIDINGTVAQNKSILNRVVHQNIPYTELILYGSKTAPTRLHIALRRNRENEREKLFKKGTGNYETLPADYLIKNFG